MKANFPLLYHLQHRDSQEDLPFWLSLAEQQAGRVLELGCGTGRVLDYLLRQGFQVCGLDRDRAMLLFLQGLLQEQGRPPALVFQADMTSFRCLVKFPLIILPCNTLSTLSSEMRLRLVDRVSAHLPPGGVFAAAVPNPALLVDLPEEAEAEEEDHFFLPDGDPVQVSSAWRRDEQYFYLRWIYDRLFSDGTVERSQVETAHSLSSAREYQGELEQSGLRVEAVFGDFDRSPFGAESPYLLLVARKPADPSPGG
jgi:SAM-dependent methyltransferase